MGYAHGSLLAPEIVEMIQKYLFETRYGGAHSAYQGALTWVSNHVTFTAATYGAELEGMLEGMEASGADLTLYLGGEVTRSVILSDLKLLNWISKWGDEAEEDEKGMIAIEGTVKSRPSKGDIGAWVVGAYAFQTNAQTKIIGTPAAGAEVRVRLRFRDGAPPLATEIVEGEGCSSFAVWGDATPTSATLAARNLDWRYDPEHGIVATYGLLIVYDPENAGENRFVSLAWPGFMGAPTAFNEYGVFLSSNWGNGSTGTLWGPGSYGYIPAGLIAREAIETADSDDPVGDVMGVVTGSKRYNSQILLVSYPYTTYPNALSGAQVIEYDAQDETIREWGDYTESYEYILATNHFVELEPDEPASTDSISRYITITTDLDDYCGNPDYVVDASEAVTTLKDVTTWVTRAMTTTTPATLHSLVAHPDERSFDVYFARAKGYDPVTMKAAPYTPLEDPFPWSSWATSQTYHLSDLFPNHPDTLTATLTHGPVVGAVTSSTARIFVRTSVTASVQISYTTDVNNPVPWYASPVQTTTPATDYTTQITLTENLTPSTRFCYDVLVDGTPQFANMLYPTFKTFPSVSGTFTVVVLNDFRTTYKNPPNVNTFEKASEEMPDLVIVGGDFDHRDPRGKWDKRQMHKDLYGRENNLEDFVDDILRKYPVAHAWDDHDYGENDADNTYPYLERSLKVLREYFPLYPPSDHTNDNGDWQKFSYSDQAEFFLLDARSQRDPNDETPDSDKSMLGTEQLAWLTNGITTSNATWKIVVSPVAFNPTVTKTDSWHGYQTERNEIVTAITGTTGVIFVSGDLHFGAIDDGTNSDFPEMLVPTSNMGVCAVSVLSEYGLAGRGVWLVGTYSSTVPLPSCDGYGVLKFYSNSDQVELEVKDDEGTAMITHTVGL